MNKKLLKFGYKDVGITVLIIFTKQSSNGPGNEMYKCFISPQTRAGTRQGEPSGPRYIGYQD